MISIANYSTIEEQPKFTIGVPAGNVKVLDGADVFDLLAPIDKTTGCRQNPLRLLDNLSDDPAISRALNSVLAELPVKGADPALSNDDLIKFMVDSASVGTPYENERFAERVYDNMDAILAQYGRNVSRTDEIVDKTIDSGVDEENAD